MNDNSTIPSFDSILASLIEAQERAKEEPVDVNAWTEKYPQFAAQIHSFFANRGKLEEVLGPRAVMDAEAPTLGGNVLAGEGQRIRYFGDYELLNEIARGGMGVVFKARQISLNRVVAVKMILSGNLAGPSDVQRFHDEAEAAAHLDHPHIVPIYEVGEHEGQHYFSMKLIDGSCLCAAKFNRPSNETWKDKQRWAASLVTQVAKAVHHAHQRGILHRDLKPGNILLDADGEPHVTDFGLAKKVEGGSDLTNTGAIVGTPAYMAPEQARCEKGLSTAVDVYSLGAILYELLTDRPPFQAKTPLDTILEVLEKEPARPGSIVQSVDRDLETITLKCLEKEPNRRFNSAEALAEELERWGRGEPISIRPVGQWERGWRWCRRNQALAASLFGVAVVLLLGAITALILAAWAFNEKERADEKTNEVIKEKLLVSLEKQNANAQSKKTQRLLGISRVDRGLQLIHDGQLFQGLLYCLDQMVVDPESPTSEETTRARFATYLHRAAPLKLISLFKQLTQQGHSYFSPDGRRVLTTDYNGTARLWDAITGQPLTPVIQHEKAIVHACFNKNGRFVLTASEDQTARVWDSNTAAPVTPFMRHEGPLRYACFSEDGSRVATTSEDKTVRVWHSATGQLLTPPIQHQSLVLHACFSPDGKRIATVEHNIICIWDSTTGKRLSPLMCHSGPVKLTCFSPDGRLLVSAASDRVAQVWNVDTGLPMSPPLRHQSMVLFASFSPDSSRVVTASMDRTARIWDALTSRPLTPMMLHQGFVNTARFSGDGRWVLTASEDKSARLWDAGTGLPHSPDLVHQGGVYEAAFSDDGQRVLTTSWDRTARVWQMSHGSLHRTPVTYQPDGLSYQLLTADLQKLSSFEEKPGQGRPAAKSTLKPMMVHQGAVNIARFSPDGHCIVTASEDCTARIWNAFTGQPLTSPMKHQGNVYQANFSPDSKRVVTASFDKTARIWNASTGQSLTQSMKHSSEVLLACFSPDGKKVLTTCFDQSARIWDSSTGLPLTKAMVHRGQINSASFSHDGQWVVTSSDDKSAQIWNANTGQPLPFSFMHASHVLYASFSADGLRVVTASRDKTAQVWDVTSGKSLTAPMVHQHDVFVGTFSSDGHRLLTASYDGTSQIWNAANGQLLMPPMRHASGVIFAKFSEIGDRVLTASLDNTARVWDSGSGQPISPPMVHLGEVRHADFSPDGNRVVTASNDRSARIWEIYSAKQPKDDLFRLGQLFAGYKIDETGSMQPLDVQNEVIPWFQKLKSTYPTEFSVTPQQARVWRENEIALCIKEGNLPAAFFHRNWLIAEMVLDAAKSNKP